jgi:glycosyltransferase involved in cell wall biosynthesis
MLWAVRWPNAGPELESFADVPPPLRILIAHNAYRLRGGEDLMVDAEAQLLRAHGHEVLRYHRHNDEVDASQPLRLLRDSVWSHRTTADLDAVFRDFRPDVLHVHNTLSLISPSVYWAAHRARVPVVQTLHNFRLMCPQALMLREGRVCTDCVGHVPWRAVVHRCYRESAAQSAAVALTLQSHRLLGTWQRKVTLYIALNAFCRQTFIDGGLPAERLRIKPNFIDAPSPPPEGARDGLLFVGRLSVEKGIDTLVRAAALLPQGTTVRVAGEGPLSHLTQAAPGLSPLGALPQADVLQAMAGATALVVPSIWYENFPRTVVEAYAQGLPVIASRLGALADLVDDGQTGLLFNPGDPVDLAAKLQWAQSHPAEMRRMGRAARTRYEQELTGAQNARQLESIYREAMALRAAELT